MLFERDLDSQDREQRLKRQKIWVILAECMMVVSVVIIVTIATLFALGYNFTKDGSVEQTGLLQLHSMPTGATVEIDGEAQFSHTNTSKSLSPTTHHLKLTRDGYDTWEKDINIISGRVNRVYYPRLFLTDRPSTTIADLSADLSFYSVSANRKSALVVIANNPVWRLADLNSDEVTWRDIDGTTFWTTNPLGNITSATWSEDGNFLLLSTDVDDITYWYLLDLQDMSQSLNLNSTFGLNFSQVTLASESADKLFALESGNLREINVASQDLSRILLSHVSEYSNSANLLAYVQQDESSLTVGTYRNGEQGGVTFASYADASRPVHVSVNNYYSDEYLTVAVGTKLSTYLGKYPNYSTDQTTVSDTLQLAAEADLSFTPSVIQHSPDDAYIITTSDNHVAVFDLEQLALTEYNSAATVHWLDDSMLYFIQDSNLTVTDFDGTNQRTLATDASSFSATITENNKYLYYINNNSQLIRQQIID